MAWAHNGIFPARQLLGMERGRFGQGWRVFEPPVGLGLDRFCSATRLAGSGRKEAPYLTRRGCAALPSGGGCGGSAPACGRSAAGHACGLPLPAPWGAEGGALHKQHDIKE